MKKSEHILEVNKMNGLDLFSGMDRIKCLGNSVVPLQVKTAFEKLIGVK